MTQRVDRIAQLLNCPRKGEEIRQAIAQSRKEANAAQEEDEAPAEPPSAGKPEAEHPILPSENPAPRTG
ncbi:hypothetical protein [Pseudomonas purpurea]|uniref:hypothetical protein n=1 Tax=Pseudomonas purpurea TaxID=3136737 RepID=UPI003267543D